MSNERTEIKYSFRSIKPKNKDIDAILNEKSSSYAHILVIPRKCGKG